MFGLDQSIAHMSDGTHAAPRPRASPRCWGSAHATDPDHVAAVSTLIAGGKERGARRARKLGLAWGLGHATTLFLFGLPVVLYERFLPEAVQQGAETAIGVLIVSPGGVAARAVAPRRVPRPRPRPRRRRTRSRARARSHAGTCRPPAPEAAVALAGVRHRPPARRRRQRRRRRAHHRRNPVEGRRRRRAGDPGARHGGLDGARDDRLRRRARGLSSARRAWDRLAPALGVLSLRVRPLVRRRRARARAPTCSDAGRFQASAVTA